MVSSYVNLSGRFLEWFSISWRELTLKIMTMIPGYNFYLQVKVNKKKARFFYLNRGNLVL